MTTYVSLHLVAIAMTMTTYVSLYIVAIVTYASLQLVAIATTMTVVMLHPAFLFPPGHQSFANIFFFFKIVFRGV